MLRLMRGKAASWIIGIIISFIAFVFIFYGVYNPRNAGGGRGGSTAGSVNGETITIGEFNSVMNRFAEGLKSRGFGEEQLKMLGVQNWAWEELVNQKILVQEAKALHLMPAEQAIRE